MTRRERLLLITFFALVLVGLGSSEPASTVLGGIGGAAVGVAAHRRLQRTSRRMDERLGADQPARKGFSWRRPLLRAGALLVVLGGLLLSTVFVPFVGDELFAASAAAVTALPAAVTALRLRR